MHLRVTEEAEMRGLDLDQFFDEQIGESDWGVFQPQDNITHGLPKEASSTSIDASMDTEAVMPEAKQD